MFRAGLPLVEGLDLNGNLPRHFYEFDVLKFTAVSMQPSTFRARLPLVNRIDLNTTSKQS